MEKIDEYLEYWNSFFRVWKVSPKEIFEKNIWSTEHCGKGKTELDPFSLPQPFLGNPKNCSVITLNLNPGPTSTLRLHKDGILTKKFIECNNYFEYAEFYPQMKLKDYPSKFWNNQFKWIERISKNERNEKLPFAIEICPWHSVKWKSLNMITPKLKEHIKQNVFEIINETIKYATIKTVLSVGKTYYDLYQNKEFGFEKIIEISPNENSILNGIKWPKNKKGELSKRFFSIWKHTETNIIYYNTYSMGSNKPPSKNWSEIENYLLKNYS